VYCVSDDVTAMAKENRDSKDTKGKYCASLPRLSDNALGVLVHQNLDKMIAGDLIVENGADDDEASDGTDRIKIKKKIEILPGE